ncbi:MAG: sulfurtransferase TusA family protein [Beijerinckiaceae bacterium]
MSTQTLDLKGLKCPLPALKARKALKPLLPGAELTLLCTDPMAAIDIPNLVRETGDVLVSQSSNDGVLTFVVRKGGA